MGVTDHRRKFCDPSNQEDNFDLIVNDDIEVEEEPTQSSDARKTYSRRHRRFRMHTEVPHGVEGSPRKKKMGVRVSRRSDNLNYLLSLVDKEELDSAVGGVDLSDLIDSSLSPFAEILTEQDKMQAWNDFINQSEEEQACLLHGMHLQNKHCLKEDLASDSDRDSLDDSWEQVEGATDKRQKHPAFSAKECFTRIDTHLKALLNKRHLPLGKLTVIEEDVTGFFREWPTSVLVSKLTSSYERLLLHALCQYLDLTSKSYDEDGGVRQTQIENKYDFFSPPDLSLSQYLCQDH